MQRSYTYTILGSESVVIPADTFQDAKRMASESAELQQANSLGTKIAPPPYDLDDVSYRLLAAEVVESTMNLVIEVLPSAETSLRQAISDARAIADGLSPVSGCVEECLGFSYHCRVQSTSFLDQMRHPEKHGRSAFHAHYERTRWSSAETVLNAAAAVAVPKVPLRVIVDCMSALRSLTCFPNSIHLSTTGTTAEEAEIAKRVEELGGQCA
jgi:hypothetical protein